MDRATFWWTVQYAGMRPPRGNRIAFARDMGAPHLVVEAPVYLQRARDDREAIDNSTRLPVLVGDENSELWVG